MTTGVNHQLVTPPNSTETHHHHEVSQSPSKPSPKSQSIQKIIKETSTYLITLTSEEQSPKSKLVLTHFLTELLKRSRSSLPIFQIAIKYYMTLTAKIEASKVTELACIKKRFLACLILSFKYHFDCQYSFKSWSKISGLPVNELQMIELEALKSLDYRLNLTVEEYQSWVEELNTKLSQFEDVEVAPVSCTFSALKRTACDVDEFSVTAKRLRLTV